ncbi:MAG TPA: phosphoribosylglycinamide formyltransferase [Burkholderiales bacterium]
MKRIVILISGRGSNMQAVLDAGLDATIAAVISNNPTASGLELARSRGVQTAVVNHREYPDRASFDQVLGDTIASFKPDLIVLAGFMRILTQAFIERFKGCIMNIHPSLLPAFPGLDTHGRAIAQGVRLHGCSVHFVTPDLDHGPIILQAAVPVLPGDTEEILAGRVLDQEHKAYPQAIRWFLEGRLAIERDRVTIAADCRYPAPIISPQPA